MTVCSPRYIRYTICEHVENVKGTAVHAAHSLLLITSYIVVAVVEREKVLDWLMGSEHLRG